MMKGIIYADHSASTPLHPEVLRTMMEVMEQVYANPSSIHELGGQAEQLVKRAREVISRCLSTEPGDIMFTSGATESNNIAILGTVRAAMQSGKRVHAITSDVEHPSVYECFKQLEREGVAVTYLPVNREGVVSLEDVEHAITPDTVLLSIMHVNNEMGSIQPIEALGAIVKKHPRLMFHVDGVQGLGKLPINLRKWNVHSYALSGHKLGGPKGLGVLVRRGRSPISPIMFGGSQEQGLRPGTVNVPGIVALAKAIRLAAEAQPGNEVKLLQLRNRLLPYIDRLPCLTLNSSRGKTGATHIINISFPGMKSEVVVHALEKQGVVISTQSACSSKLHKPSRVLLAVTNDDSLASSGLRISLSPTMTEQEMDQIGQALQSVVEQLEPLVKQER